MSPNHGVPTLTTQLYKRYNVLFNETQWALHLQVRAKSTWTKREGISRIYWKSQVFIKKCFCSTASKGNVNPPLNSSGQSKWPLKLQPWPWLMAGEGREEGKAETLISVVSVYNWRTYLFLSWGLWGLAISHRTGCCWQTHGTACSRCRRVQTGRRRLSSGASPSCWARTHASVYRSPLCWKWGGKNRGGKRSTTIFVVTSNNVVYVLGVSLFCWGLWFYVVSSTTGWFPFPAFRRSPATRRLIATLMRFTRFLPPDNNTSL